VVAHRFSLQCRVGAQLGIKEMGLGELIAPLMIRDDLQRGKPHRAEPTAPSVSEAEQVAVRPTITLLILHCLVREVIGTAVHIPRCDWARWPGERGP
jgi:hypothetical protein